MNVCDDDDDDDREKKKKTRWWTHTLTRILCIDVSDQQTIVHKSETRP